MRILIEQSGYGLHNMGDWAMLAVAIERCRALFPHARLDVMGDTEPLRRHFGDTVRPIPTSGRDRLLGNNALLGGFSRFARGLDRRTAMRSPQIAAKLVRVKRRLAGKETADLDLFVDALSKADLVIASGGGYLTDVFVYMAMGVPPVLQSAQLRGIPTAMFGQGLGPLQLPWLRKRVGDMLCGLDLLTLREGLDGPPLARDLGVPDEHVIITGDDAIKTAHAQRRETLGDRLGLNLRVTDYSAAGDDDVRRLKDGIGRVLDATGAEPTIVPISLREDEDRLNTARLLPDGVSVDAASAAASSPEDIVQLAGRCRVVITGSYHAGVFALSQGVPVIGLYKSPYYKQKFDGLAVQFGEACSVVPLADEKLSENLSAEALRLWSAAEVLRGPTLARAEAQIELADEAWSRLHSLV